MRSFFMTALLLYCLALNCRAQKAEHVIIITIDGFRPDFYLDPSWGMVNLRQLREEGVYAEKVHGVFPTVTFVNHTTIVTGEKPVNHGILYNAPFQPKGESSEWYWFHKDIKAPTLWGVAKENGLTTAAVNWPVSVGGPIDYNIPIFKKKGEAQLDVIRRHSKPATLFEEVQQHATGTLEPEDFIVQKDYLAMDANVGRMSAYIIRKYKPSLFTIRLSAVDHFQHEEGREGRMVRAAVAGADRAIRDVLEALERAGIRDKSTLIVTGDHGFVNTHTSLAPNIWLKQAGLIGKNGDWKAQFHTVGGAAFLMLKDRRDKASLNKVMEVLQNRPPRERKLYQFISRKELDSLGADPQPVFGLKATPGVIFRNATDGDLIKPHRQGTHGYYPDIPEIKTGFVAYGAGIREGLFIPEMNLEDVAPLVAELLGVKLTPKDGILLDGILKE